MDGHINSVAAVNTAIEPFAITGSCDGVGEKKGSKEEEVVVD